MNKNNLVVEREKLSFSMTRTFDAPRKLVWKAHTDPNLLPKWWGPRNMTTTVEKLDLRPGGAYRFIQTGPDGSTHAFRGVFTEVVPHERLGWTFEYEPMPGHISRDTVIFEELPGGRTKLTSYSTFDNLEDLEGMLQSGMEGGAVETYDRLGELLAEM